MKRIIIGILFTTIWIQSYAQEANGELKNLINQSFTYFPRLKELDQAVKISQQRVELASLGNKPNIGANLDYSYVWPVPTVDLPKGNGETEKFQFQPNHNFNAFIALSTPIYDFGRTKAAIDRAKEDLVQSKNTIEYNKAQLAAQVATIYYTIIYLKQAISLEDSVIYVLQANKKFVEDKYKNGDALKVDVLTWDNNIDIEQNRKVDLQNSLQKQYNLLSYATGQTVAQINQGLFDFSTSLTSIDEALKTAQVSNYEYIIAHERVKQSEADLAITKLNSKPSINFNGTTGLRNGYIPQLNILKYNFTLGVGVSIPIYSGGRYKKQIQIAESAVTQNELAVTTLDNQYKRDIAQALTDIQSNRERLSNAAGQISVAQEVLRLAQLRYKDGVGTNVDVLNANNNLQRVQLSSIQYQYQLGQAQVELARLTGVKYW
jgi:outer membrane protein